jgi:hypothetical protein
LPVRTACNFDRELPFANTASSWMNRTAASLLEGCHSVDLNNGPRHEAFTASSAWNTILAMRQNTYPRMVVPSWGLSQNISAIEISQTSPWKNRNTLKAESNRINHREHRDHGG